MRPVIHSRRNCFCLLTLSDGRLQVANLPAGEYHLCVPPLRTDQLATCEWVGARWGDAGPTWIKLTTGQSVTNLRLVLRSGTMVRIHVEDREQFSARGFGFLVGVSAEGGEYRRAEQMREASGLVFAVAVPRTAVIRLPAFSRPALRASPASSPPTRFPCRSSSQIRRSP